jgi:acetyl esterase/lipase
MKTLYRLRINGPLRSPSIVCALALAALASPLRAADAQGDRAPRHDVDVRANITYYSGEGADKYRHRLDLFLPRGQRDVPVLLFVHGGGFTVGIKDQYAFVGQVFAARGIATAVISYRLSPKVSYPGHVQDVARAFAWVRAHIAEYGGKPDRIFVSGHSAGATLVAMLASDPAYLKEAGESPDHIAGVIPISGSFTQSARSAMFQGPSPVDPDIVRNASAIVHAAGPHPPFLILYGDRDAQRTGEDAEQMAKALKAAGNSADVHEIADHAHMDMITGIMSPDDAGLRFVLEFIRRVDRQRP